MEVTQAMLFFDPFAPLLPRAGAFLAPVDVTVGERDVVVTFDLPGVTSGDLEIQVLGEELVLRGERRRPEPAAGTTWARAERPFGAFERRIRLPRGVDPDAITASLDEGVLSLIIPKPERLQPTPIPIGTATQQRELEHSAA